MLTIIVIMALLARDVPSSVEKPNVPNNELEETIFNFSKVIKANKRQTNNYVDRSIPILGLIWVLSNATKCKGQGAMSNFTTPTAYPCCHNFVQKYNCKRDSNGCFKWMFYFLPANNNF